MDTRPEHAGDDTELEDLVYRCLEAPDPYAELRRRVGDRPDVLATAERILAQVTRLEDSAAGAVLPPAFLREALAADGSPSPDDRSTWPAIPGVELECLLGRGGQGYVFRGRQTYLDRKVAVKVLARELETPAFVERFRREARMLASLQHPHVVACHQAGVTDAGRCHLVMELIDGPDLRAFVAQHGPLPLTPALRLVRDLADALAHAGRLGLVHRDVKPENVLLQPTANAPGGAAFPFVAKLADLGLARSVGPAHGFTLLTPAGAMLGTPVTMAPEQFDAPDRVDHRADIYGLGCVLHHALAGRPAFAGTAVTELVVEKLARGKDEPVTLPGVPAEVCHLVGRMLASRPDDRPQSYDELLGQLDRLLAGRRATPHRRRMAGGAALMLVACLGLGAGGYAWWRGHTAALRTELVVAAPPRVVEGTAAIVGYTTAPDPALPATAVVVAGPPVRLSSPRAGEFAFTPPFGTGGEELTLAVFVVSDPNCRREVRVRIDADARALSVPAGGPRNLFEAPAPLSLWRTDAPERWQVDESGRGVVVNASRQRVVAELLLPRGDFALAGDIEPRFRYESGARPRVPLTSTGLRLELGADDAVVLRVEPPGEGSDLFRARWQRQRRVDDQWTGVADLGACEGAWALATPMRFGAVWHGDRLALTCGTRGADPPVRTEVRPLDDWQVPWRPGRLEVHADGGSAVFTDWAITAPK